jgi:beta-lactamase class A
MWMRFTIAIVLAIVSAVICGCNSTGQIPLDIPPPQMPEPAKPAPKMEYKRDRELEKQFADIAKDAQGRVGAAAVVLDTGEAALLNADEHYPMQSVYKLPIAMAMMEEIRQGNHELDEKVGVTKDDMVPVGFSSFLRDKAPAGGEFTIRDLIVFSLVYSDGTASDVLLRVLKNPAEVQSFLTQIGVRDMKVVNTEKEVARQWQLQYDNWATPAASIDLLSWLDKDAKGWRAPADDEASNSEFLLQLMAMSTPGRRRIKKLLPLDETSVVAHKTGTGGTHGDGIDTATNDIGIIYTPKRKIAIAVYVSDSRADERTREGIIAKIAKAAWDRWNE